MLPPAMMPRRTAPPQAPPRQGAVRSLLRRPSATTRGWRSKFANCSSGVKPTPRASDSPRWSRCISGAPSESPISTSGTRLRPTKRCRTPSSRCSPHRHLPRGVAVRGLVHAHSHQRLPGSAQVHAAPRTLDCPDRSDRQIDDARSALAPHPPEDPEARLLSRERRQHLATAIDRLDGRQRTVFMLCHYGDCTPREVSAMTGLNESTVRVHLFRAARKLRALLGGRL